MPKTSLLAGSAAASIAGAAAVALTVALLPPTALAAPQTDAAAQTDTANPPPTPLTGKTVFLDPGHQGTGHSEDLSRPVPDGRGGTKDCQTTGMTTVGGVAEHTITWDVSQLVKAGLEKLGATVKLSRSDDTGWGGCVDDRARAANASGADLAVSVHADSTSTGADAADRGFHLIVPALPIPDSTVNTVQSGPGLAASKAIRDAYLKGGFTPANYAGVVDGLQTRDDIAGPALTTVPLAFVEMGNGSNPDDAAVLDTAEGRLKHAVAIITGAVDYLMGATDLPGVATATTAPPATATTTPPQVERSDTGTTTRAAPATTPPSTADTAPPLAGLLTDALSAIQSLLSGQGLAGVEDLLTSGNVGLVSGLLQALLQSLR